METRAYIERDYRIKCRTCRRWMQFVPTAKGVTRVRRRPPHAGTCTSCPITGTRGRFTR
jgi:hypothetical protein